MASILSSFMKEISSSSSPIENQEKEQADITIRGNDSIIGGTLVISGCVDWDRSVGYKGNDSKALDEPMIIKFNQSVLKTFSSSSSFHLFIQLIDGSIYGLGRNSNGQLGCNSKILVEFPILIDIPEPKSKVIKISTGSKHSLMLLESGFVYASGSNLEGACGLGSHKSNIKDHLKFTKIESLKDIIDISCGDNFSVCVDREGNLFSFGHPEEGQLGQGTTGEFIQKAGKVSYTFVFTPTKITKFFQREVVFGSSAKIKQINDEIKFCKVACGAHHCIALEEYESLTTRGNRVFSWGNSGNGRTGHNCQDACLSPVEISGFSDPDNKNITKHVRDISCGSTFSIAVSRTRNLYYFGKMANSSRGEATMYPKMINELVGYPISECSCGSNCIMVSSSDVSIAWGIAVAGKFGFLDDKKGSIIPALVQKVNGLYTSNISNGYYHCCMVVNDKALPAIDTSGHSNFSHKSNGEKIQIKNIPIWIDVSSNKNDKRKATNDDNSSQMKKKTKKKG